MRVIHRVNILSKINIKEMNKEIKYFIITGEPGVGKTTLIKKLCSMLREKNVKTTGFVTEEVRQNGKRQGFDIVTLNGTRGTLARDQQIVGSSGYKTVGKYCVFLSEFEKVALPYLLMGDDDKSCLIIDEIGKMELLSSLFKTKIKELFQSRFNKYILASIPFRSNIEIVEFIRNHSNASIWTITWANRNSLHEDIFKQMEMSMNI